MNNEVIHINSLKSSSSRCLISRLFRFRYRLFKKKNSKMSFFAFFSWKSRWESWFFKLPTLGVSHEQLVDDGHPSSLPTPVSRSPPLSQPPARSPCRPPSLPSYLLPPCLIPVGLPRRRRPRPPSGAALHQGSLARSLILQTPI